MYKANQLLNVIVQPIIYVCIYLYVLYLLLSDWSSSPLRLSLLSSSSVFESVCLLCFMRRFWNQTFTCNRDGISLSSDQVCAIKRVKRGEGAHWTTGCEQFVSGIMEFRCRVRMQRNKLHCEALTCRSVRSRLAAISILLGRHKYLLKWNSFSSSSSWVLVYAVRSRRGRPFSGTNSAAIEKLHFVRLRLAEWMWILFFNFFICSSRFSHQHVSVRAWPWYMRQQIAFAIGPVLRGFHLSISARNQSISSSEGITNSEKLAQLDKKTFSFFQQSCRKVQLMPRRKSLDSSVFPAPLSRDTRSSSVK